VYIPNGTDGREDTIMDTELMVNVAYNMAQRNYHVAVGILLGMTSLVMVTVFVIVMMQKLYAYRARKKAQQFRRAFIHEGDAKVSD